MSIAVREEGSKRAVSTEIPPNSDASNFTIPPRLAAGISGVLVGLALVKAYRAYTTKNSRGAVVAPVDLEDLKGKRIVVIVNGINHSSDRFTEKMNHAGAFFEGCNVDEVMGFHNETHSRLHDNLQVVDQKLHSLIGRLPRTTQKVSSQLGDFLTDLVDRGASVVVIGHSAGCFFTHEALSGILKGKNPGAAGRMRFLSMGTPLHRHAGDSLGTHIVISNEFDRVTGRHSGDNVFNVETPIPDVHRKKRDHHRTETGYLVRGTKMGETVQGAVAGLFDSIPSDER